MLYGMIGILGARIWVQNKVDFSDPVNLTTAAVPLVVGIANFTWAVGDLTFEGIALGTAAALVIYHVMRNLSRWRGTTQEPASPASAPGATSPPSTRRSRTPADATRVSGLHGGSTETTARRAPARRAVG